MKNITIYKIMAFLVTLTVVLGSCTKEMSEIRLEPTLSTSQTFGITSDSATVAGFVVASGDGFTEKGVCYNTSANPTIDDNKVAYTEETNSATFNVILSGLSYATRYYARAYATGESGTVYGEEVTFTTLPVAPTLTTAAITEITGNSATGGGNITVTGGAEITARGICYSTEPNPTVSDTKTSDGEGDGEFVSALADLKGNTEYFVRAYATNSAGIGYGPEVSFTTLVDLPAVTTTPVTEITKTSAVSGGEVTYDGGSEITERGLVWGLNSEPTVDDNKISGGAGVGTFISTLNDLELSTTYHLRAFAINSAGISYGENLSFTTLADITQFWIVGSYNGWDNSDNAAYIISTESSEGTAEGYVYLTAGEIKLTTDHSWDDAHTFGDNGAGGLTNPGNNITVGNDGYYLIKASLADMSYSLTPTAWGVIGSATPMEWNDETPLTFDPASGTWRGVMHLTAAEIKFRANHDWGLNYGSDAADGTLTAGGANIPIAVEADYAIVLDLSTPNGYMYAVNRWGIIGDATPGGWDSDQDMIWDEVNQVFTVTLDLTTGTFKFRANDDWGLNYGGNVNSLSEGGDNIPIDEGGNYTITFDPWGLTAAVIKN
jgi:starch-binding outer membrane protein SusE/F